MSVFLTCLLRRLVVSESLAAAVGGFGNPITYICRLFGQPGFTGTALLRPLKHGL